jgi:hypothetical protein
MAIREMVRDREKQSAIERLKGYARTILLTFSWRYNHPEKMLTPGMPKSLGCFTEY